MNSLALSVGRLVSLDLKLGVAVSSDLCKKMHTPYVSVLARIEESPGSIKETSFEMSISQFQTFAKSFKDISAFMDSL